MYVDIQLQKDVIKDSMVQCFRSYKLFAESISAVRQIVWLTLKVSLMATVKWFCKDQNRWARYIIFTHLHWCEVKLTI